MNWCLDWASNCIKTIADSCVTDAGQLDDDYDCIVERLQQCLARQLAHSKVLYDLCNAHGLDYNAVLKLAGIPERCNPLDDGDIDEAFYQQWLSDLSECLPKT